MTDLLPKLGRVFVFGIAYAIMLAGMGFGAWLLYRLAGKLRDLGRPPEERKRRKEEARHPFREMSLRAKAAWLICCLEEALCACGLDAEPDEPGCWYPILRLLWEVDELPDAYVVTKWMDEVEWILPSEVLSCNPGPASAQSIPPERERLFAAAYALYHQAGPRMAFLAPLLENVYALVRDCWEDSGADSLGILLETQRLLEDYGIPLPPQGTVDFLLKFQGPGPGEVFVGRQCSSGLVGW